ncbi:MAG TPA: gephyrin-like molybdotransferase Glp [Candidatus Acidoferrales bacterium]|nr:gephyrin-like molybdotransferase Glp [Candidatus Acidoferrales bacterium]
MTAEPSGLMRVEEAQARILALLGTPAAGTDEVAVEAALGRVLAAPVVAATALPPWDNSAMDGYAVVAADLAAASETNPARLAVIGDLAAGTAPSTTVRPGTAIRIATGAPIPPGADAVVQVELTTPLGADDTAGSRGRDAAGPLPPAVLVHAAVGPGTHIRRAGSDLAAGARLLEPGTAIGPAHVGLVAGAGLATVTVHRRPRVGVLATGDELRAAGEPLGPAEIPNSNGPGLRALVMAAGAEAIDLGIARDVQAVVSARLAAGIEAGCDAIVVSGGVSVGPYDVVKAAFAELGTVDLWRVAVQPGKPFALGVVARAGGPPVLLFGLPGNPVSGVVTFELFVRPAIRVLAGRRDPLRPLDRAVLLDAARKSSGRRAYLRVTAEREVDGAAARDERGRVLVRLAGGAAGQGSHVLSALAASDALAIVPEDLDAVPAGSPVDLLWLDAP